MAVPNSWRGYRDSRTPADSYENSRLSDLVLRTSTEMSGRLCDAQKVARAVIEMHLSRGFRLFASQWNAFTLST